MIPRELGEKVSVSIGTALPLEEKLLVEKVTVNELWISLHTLFRNFHEAYPDPSIVPRGEMLSEFVNEAHTVRELLQGTVNVVYYQTDISNLQKIFPLAKIKTPTTPRQKIYANNERLALTAAMSHKELGIVPCKQLVHGKNAKAWIMTHHPMDLLSRYEFSELSLISSHTGDIKKPVEWIKKLTSNRSYHRLPFNIMTLQVLGDGAVQFFSQSPSIKKHLLAMAESGKWKPTTTRDKIVSDMSKYPNKEIADTFRKMFSVKLI